MRGVTKGANPNQMKRNTFPYSDPESELYKASLGPHPGGRRLHKWHHYFDIYENHFKPWRGQNITLLEIGVFGGGSLDLWRNYFGPETQIIGIDVTESCVALADERTKIFIGDQADRKFLRDVLSQVGPLDIVIDDGGHTMNQMITSFEEIYPRLTSPGVYLVEDVHTCFFGGEYDDRADHQNFLSYAFDRVVDLHDWTRQKSEVPRFGQLPTKRVGELECSEFCRRTGGIHFYDSVVVFDRRDRPEPWHQART